MASIASFGREYLTSGTSMGVGGTTASFVTRTHALLIISVKPHFIVVGITFPTSRKPIHGLSPRRVFPWKPLDKRSSLYFILPIGG